MKKKKRNINKLCAGIGLLFLFCGICYVMMILPSNRAHEFCESKDMDFVDWDVTKIECAEDNGTVKVFFNKMMYSGEEGLNWIE